MIERHIICCTLSNFGRCVFDTAPNKTRPIIAQHMHFIATMIFPFLQTYWVGLQSFLYNIVLEQKLHYYIISTSCIIVVQ